MSAIQNLFQQSQLAEAAYANFFSDSGALLTGDEDVSTALRSQGFSATQAADFVAHWQVVSQLPDTSGLFLSPYDGDGFSATLFQRKDADPSGAYQAGQYVLAIKGTAGELDLMADAGDIAFDGVALDQTVALYNYWQQLKAPKDQPYEVAVLVNVPSGVVLASNQIIVDGPTGTLRTIQFVSSTNAYGAGDPRQTGLGLTTDVTSIEVTGHSLGGHLSSVFTRLFPGLNVTATTINGAGFPTGEIAGLGGHAQSNIANLFSMLGGSDHFGTIYNVSGSAAIDVVTMDSTWGLKQQGVTQEIFTESYSLANIIGHGSSQMTDSLAVYDLFIRLSPSLQNLPLKDVLQRLEPIFSAAAVENKGVLFNAPSAALENIVNAFGKLYVPEYIPISNSQLDDREVLYAHLKDIRASMEGKTATIISLANIDTSNIAAMVSTAQQADAVGLAYRYALKELNPFVVVGADYSTTRNSANADLALYDAATGTGLTDAWLTDRAAMLSWKLKAATEDRDFSKEDVLNVPQGSPLPETDIAGYGSPQYFKDIGSGEVLNLSSTSARRMFVFGSDSSDVIRGGNYSDRLYGGADNDYLDGKEGDDYLEGGTGNDILIGGTGSNILMGGLGDDVYYVTTGTGNTNKIIETREADGKIHGYLFINGKFSGSLAEKQYAATGTWIKDATRANTWVSATNPSMILTHNSPWRIVTDDGSEIELGDFQDGDFGITLVDPVVTLPTTTRLIQGDLAPIDFDPVEPGVQTQTDVLGNVIVDPGTPAPDRADTLFDSAGNDHIFAGGGDDHVFLERGGDNWAQGGDGSDIIENVYGVPGNNTIEGNAGADILAGGDGTDTIFAADKINIDTALAQGATAEGVAGKGEWLDGHGGKDILVGAATDDVLMGGEGDDLLIGGGGDDTIYGDGTTLVVTRDWAVTRVPIPKDDHTEYTVTFTNAAVDDLATGNDILMGGAGKDWIFGGYGDDQIYGGNDDDVLFGGDGNNYLDGGEGTDIVVGGIGDDFLIGGNGNDFLHGTTYGDQNELGNDTLIGGAGDDFMNGYLGDDVYYISSQDGHDTIKDSGGQDTLNLAVDWQSIKVGRQTEGIVLTWEATPTNHVGITTESAIETFQFADRTLNIGEVLSRIDPSNYNIVTGTAGAPVLATGGAVSRLSSTDALGDTTYLIQDSYLAVVNDAGGVADMVDLGPINSTQAHYIRLTNDDLLITLDNGAKITIEQHFAVGNANKIEAFQFADAIIDTTSLDGLTPTIVQASQGDDTLLGTTGNDVLNGWVGNDTLVGGEGNDTYEFYHGDGNDLIDDNDATLGNVDSILFMDVASTEVALKRVGTNLVIFSGSDSVTVKSFFEGAATEVESIAFSDGISWNVDEIKAHVTIDGTSGNDLLEGFANSDDRIYGFAGNDQLQGFSGNDLLDGGTGDDTLFGQEGDDQLIGGDGNDVLVASSGNDSLNGDSGDDTLYGQEGDDRLNGGSGNDTLIGNSGNDTYVFNLGWGQDVIREETDTTADVLQFGAGISPKDIMAVQSGADLVLYHSNNVDQIRITNWYANPAYQVSRFEFADGTVWTAQEVNDRGSVTLRGTLGSDAMTGTSLGETLYGLDGDDTLNGAGGNDVLVGGRGNDTLLGSAGTNTYLFAEGDGVDLIYGSTLDTLKFAAGISSTDVTVERIGSDLVFRQSNGTDGVTVAGWYSQSSSRISKVTFESEATIWQTAQLDSMGININHNYVFDIGMGAKIIEDWGGLDSLVFATSIADADIIITREGQNLKLNHLNGSDSFTVKDWFNDINRQVETVSFSGSGNFLTAAQLTTPFLTLTGTAGNDILQGGNAYAETLSGLAGDDTISGGGGGDHITGGTGNDQLSGGEGIDTYYFNLGDGQDTITDTTYDNTLILGPGLMSTLTVTGGTSGQDTLYTFGTGTDSVTVKAGSKVNLKFEDFGTAGADVMNGSSFGDVMHGLDDADTLNGNGGADILYGDAGNDTLLGGSNSDYLYGGDGDDILDGHILTGSSDSETHGSDAQDFYYGGKGDDTLYGNSSADIYYFNLGDGNDVITEGYYLSGGWQWSSSDQLIFGAGITAENVSYTKSGDDLFVSVSPTDSVTIKNWFIDSMAWVDYFSFSDGSLIYANEASRKALTVYGSSGNDVLTGHASFADVLYGEAGDDTLDGQGGDDWIEGGEGNDQLYGRDGDDVIYGDAGDDRLFGGAGINTLAGGAGDDLIYGGGSGGGDYYRFSLGDGHDVISDSGGSDSLSFSSPITASDVLSTRNANDLVLTISDTDESVTLKNYFGRADYSFSYGNTSFRRSGYTTKVEVISFGGGGFLDDLSIRGADTNDALSGSNYSDVMYGNGGNDVLHGLDDEDTLYGNDGDDAIYGDNANDNLSGGAGNDYLDGGDGTDLLDAGDGNDTLKGGASTDYLIGGYGSDSYLYSVGDGYDEIWDYGYSNAQDVDQILLAQGIDITDLDFSRSSDSLQVHVGSSYILVKNQYTSSRYGIERIQFADGGSIGLTDIQTATAASVMNGTSADSILTGSSSADTLYGNEGNDWLDGSLGADKLIGGMGDDRYFVDNRNDVVTELAGEGLDTIYTSSISFTASANVENLVLSGSAAINATGNTLNNYLRGNSGNNTLGGSGGNDILMAGDGTDVLKDTAGNNLFHGGSGADTFTGATGRELFIGGTGNDTITTGTGYDVIAFNKGDGLDAINVSTGLDNTISLGGDFSYSDLSLSKSGKNLILKVGATDQITLTNWYAKSTNRSVLNLQVIAEAMADFDAGSADPLRNNLIETFDFAGLVAQFDAAGAPANWQLTDSRLTAHLKDGSDIAAIGGDLAYQYGMNGSLTGIGLLAAQNVISAAAFGQSSQMLNPSSSWQAETVKLA